MTAALKNTPDPINTPTTVENAPKNHISFFNFVKIYLLKNIINNDICINKNTLNDDADPKVLKCNKVHMRTHRRSGLLISKFAYKSFLDI